MHGLIGVLWNEQHYERGLLNRLAMKYFAFVLILAALAASDSISGCAGNVRVSREILKYNRVKSIHK